MTKKNTNDFVIVNTPLRMPEDLRNELEFVAQENNESFNGFMLTLGEKAVKEHKDFTMLPKLPLTAMRKAKNKIKKGGEG